VADLVQHKIWCLPSGPWPLTHTVHIYPWALAWWGSRCEHRLTYALSTQRPPPAAEEYMYWKWSTPCCTTPPTEEGHESGAPEAGHAQAHGRGGALETCGHAELVRRAEHLSDPTSSRPCLARNRGPSAAQQATLAGLRPGERRQTNSLSRMAVRALYFKVPSTDRGQMTARATQPRRLTSLEHHESM
jgi:hypothetical protein